MKATKKNKRKIEHWELVSLLLMVYDFVAILVSYLAALGIRFGCRFDGSIECNIQSSVKDFVFSYKKSLLIGKLEDCSS